MAASRTVQHRTWTARGVLLALLAALIATGPVPARAADPLGPFDGDPTTSQRLHAREPITAGIAVSRARFDDGAARVAVLSRHDLFADSLGGSALTTDGPLLFTGTNRLAPGTRAELRRVLPAGATVYLLGGPAALGSDVESALAADGHRPVRLRGPDRITTALAVADEVVRLTGGAPRALLARSAGTSADPTAGWADSVTAGGVAARDRTPVLLTGTADLDPRVRAWLDHFGVRETILLGGPAALSEAVAAAVPGPRRLRGAERTATAAVVARTLWPSTSRLTVTSARHPSGWAFGLAAGGLAADAGAPLVLVEATDGGALRGLVASCGAARIDAAIIGDGSVVTPRVREAVDAYDGGACGRDGSLAFSAALTPYGDCTTLLADFRAAALERVGPYGLENGYGYPIAEPVDHDTDDSAGEQPEGAPVPTPAPAQPDGGDEGGDPRSGTNVQEDGVDEPDIVKDDGHLALAIARGRLQVIDLTGATPRLVANPTLPPGYGHQLLLHDRTALVLSSGGGYGGEHSVVDDMPGVAPEPGTPPGLTPEFAPAPPSTPRVTVTSVDLTDPTAPTVTAVTHVDGFLRSARSIDGTVRMVVQSGPTGLAFTFPQDGSAEALAAAAAENRRIVAEAPLATWLPAYRTGTGDGSGEGAAQPLLDCADVTRPPWQDGLDTLSVVTFPVDDPTPSSSAGVVAQGETVYASLDQLVVSTSRWHASEPGLTGETITTELHAFAIADPAETRYLASGSVPGHLLNSFSVSEREGRLRVATTTEAPWRPDQVTPDSESAVRVLERRGRELVQVGAVGGLGRGERIFAVRFIGDLAAVVTFRQVDPLYLIDLAVPTAPRLTGELKIPGFSSYLHPVGEDLLLGVGQDATDDGQVTGLQVSLFDISDRSAPRRVATHTQPRAYSEVANDHKAFLYWTPSRLAVVPTVMWTDRGAQLDALGLEVGAASLTVRGRTTHQQGPDDHGSQIRRTFVIGERLHTVSERGLGVHGLSDLAQTAFVAFDEAPIR